MQNDMPAEYDPRRRRDKESQLVEREMIPLTEVYHTVRELTYHDSAKFVFPQAVYSRNTFLTINDTSGIDRIITAHIRVNRPIVEKIYREGNMHLDEEALAERAVLDNVGLYGVDRFGLSVVTQKSGHMTRTDYTWRATDRFRTAMEKDVATVDDFFLDDLQLQRERAEYPMTMPRNKEELHAYLLEQHPGLNTSKILPENTTIHPSSPEITGQMIHINRNWGLLGRRDAPAFIHFFTFEFTAKEMPNPPVREDTI